MIAWSYARKSTEQEQVSDDEKSITSQTEEAQAFMRQKGWTPGAVWSDDGISGAEFDRRPGFKAMMTCARSGHADAQVLVVRTISRFGREMAETLMNLKWLDQAGIQVWSYLDGEFFDMSDPVKILTLLLKAFAADMPRATGRAEVMRAMQRKAEAGHVISSLPYGYERMTVTDAAGKRSHTGRRIVPERAAIIKRIFTQYASGSGKGTIAKALNADGIASPRGGRWTQTTIYGILANTTYRGELISHRYAYKDKWAQQKYFKRPPTEWIRVKSEADRIISNDLWRAVEARHADEHAKIAQRGDPPRRTDVSRYMLTNFARCGLCGGAMCVASRKVPGMEERERFYRCLNYQLHGNASCQNATSVTVPLVNAAILSAIRDILDVPRLVTKIVAAVLEKQQAAAAKVAAPQVRKRLARLEKEIANLTAALSRGGLPSIYDALADRERQAAALRAELSALDRPVQMKTWTVPMVTKRVRAGLTAWSEGLSAESMEKRRHILRTALDGPITFTPEAGIIPITRRCRNQFGKRRDLRAFRFSGTLTLLPAIAGIVGSAVIPMSDASRMPSVRLWKPSFSGIAA